MAVPALIQAFAVTLALAFGIPKVSLAQDAKGSMLGIVDTRRAIVNCKTGQEAQKRLNGLMEKKRDSFSPKEEEVKKLEAEFETQKFVLSQDALEERRIEIARKKSALERGVEEAREEMAVEERKAFQPLLTKVEGILKEIGKEKGFMVILEKSSPGVLYYSDTLDITDVLIDRLNKS